MGIKTTKFLLGALGEIASLLHGGVASGLRIVQNILTMGFGMVFQYNKEAVAFAREVGLTAKQAQAYTEVLTTRAKDLGAKYGIAAEAVAQLERNLARATGRALMLSQVETERMVQINKLVGESTFNQFAEQMFAMGGQISSMQGAVSKAYATAAKNGLNASKMAEKVAQNLSMANRLSFKNGVDGITKMAMMAEKFGISMSSVEGVANKFIDLQDAIETSASLSMLGGAIGAYGGNPLDMSYEANADPEALLRRMEQMIAGQAHFDKAKGESVIGPGAMDYVRAMSKALGVSVEELTKGAKKVAEVRYKEGNFGNTLNNLARDENGIVNKELRDFLINKTQIHNGKLMMTDSRGNLRDMNYYQSTAEGKAELKELTKYNRMSHDKIVETAAMSLISFEEQFTGWMTTLKGVISEKIVPYLPKIQQFLGDLYKMVLPHVGTIANNIKGLMGKLFSEEGLATIKKYAKSAIDFFMLLPKLLTSSWAKLFGGVFLGAILGIITWSTNTISGILAGRAGSGAGAGAGAASGWANGVNFANRINSVGKANGWGFMQRGRAGLAGMWRASSGFRNSVRGAGALAAVIGGYSVYNSISNYNEAKKNIEQDENLSAHEKQRQIDEAAKVRNRDIAGTTVGIGGAALGTWLGGAIGTAIAPGLGTTIGMAAGAALGNWLGSSGGTAIADAIQGRPEEHARGGAVGGKVTPPGKAIMTLAETNTNNDNVARASKDNILTYLGEGEVVLNEPQQKVLLSKMGVIPTYSPGSHNDNAAVNTMLTSVVAKPVGEKTVIYVPQNNSTVNGGNSTVTVNDINVKFSGSIRLDGGSAYRDIDIKELLDSPAIKSYIADMVMREFKNKVNMKPMNDTRSMMGYSESSGVAGRMSFA